MSACFAALAAGQGWDPSGRRLRRLTASSPTDLLPFQPMSMSPAQLAAAVSYLARYSGRTRHLLRVPDTAVVLLVREQRPTQGADAEQKAQRTVMNGEYLGDLKEPDQFEPIQALGAGLVAVDLGQDVHTPQGRRRWCRRCGRSGRTRGHRASS